MDARTRGVRGIIVVALALVMGWFSTGIRASQAGGGATPGASPVASPAATPDSSDRGAVTYANAEKGQAIVVVREDMDNVQSARLALLPSFDGVWQNAFAPKLTLGPGREMSAELLRFVFGETGSTFEATYAEGRCTACPTMILLVQRGQIVTLTMLVETEHDEIAPADLRALYEYTMVTAVHPTGTLPVPAGFTLVPPTS